MQQVFEATWHQGNIIPKDSVNIKENSQLIIIVVDHSNINKKYDWQNLRGKYKGKLSSTEKFINNKRVEKKLEL